MAKRISKKIVTAVSADQYQDAMSAYAVADATAEKKVAQMNVELTRIREKYDGDLASLLQQKENAFDVVQAYCMENKGMLFTKIRHIETAHGKVGFRLGTPKLKTLPKFTWDRVLEKIEGSLPQFVRVKKEVDKEGILHQREEACVAPLLASIGVYIDQDETFYIDLKREEV